MGENVPLKERLTSPVALARSWPTRSTRKSMHWSGVHFPRWKLSENIILAHRWVRQKSMPILSSGDFGQPMSQNWNSHHTAQPSTQNGVVNSSRWGFDRLE